MTNLTDITAVTDAVLDIFLASKTGAEPTVEHLTVTERSQLAGLMGWERTPFLAAWIADAPADAVDTDTRDYEGAILDRQDARDGDYL
jgi:hypothetical protein